MRILGTLSVAVTLAFAAAPTLQSAYVDHDFGLTADPQTPEWRTAPSVQRGA
jgi:hypothetical protein